MDFANNYNGTILIVDLEKGETSNESLDEALVEECLGGAALNLKLYEQYADRNPVVLGTGLFTATFVPAACLGVATFKSPLNGGICHVPLTWQTGVELKLTGFDFVVMLGSSAKPVRLWLHDGLADVEDSADVWGKSTWETVDGLRQTYGDDQVQVLCIGPAGESKSALAQVSESYWGSKDKSALGRVFGEKKLKAVALRGLGMLEVADGFFDRCSGLMKEITGGALKGKQGLKATMASLPQDQMSPEVLDSITHRNNACYNCAYACNTFVKYREPAGTMAISGVAEPGCQVTDLSGLLSFGFLGKDAAAALEQCFRLGLEPSGAAQVVKAQGAKDLQSATEKLALLAASAGGVKEAGLPHFCGVSSWPIKPSPEAGLAQAFGVFSNAVPPMPVAASWESFGVKGSPVDKAAWWLKRQSLAYILGICPIFALASPELSEQKLAELANCSLGCEDFGAEKLEQLAVETVRRSLKAGARQGEVHPSLQGDGFEAAYRELVARFS
jgi:aldehyde:ferredoxin oxidoreductase